MADLNRTLLDLFRFSDGLLLPDESVVEEISKKQHELKVWNEGIVLQGLITESLDRENTLRIMCGKLIQYR